MTYQAISVANGMHLYADSGCALCHGSSGHGDGPSAGVLRPKPTDLTAAHAGSHTAGDLFWWLSYGMNQSAMPGFGQRLSEEERWDLVNFVRALSGSERARDLAPTIEAQPWLVAPDFTYATGTGDARTLRDHRGTAAVLLVLLGMESGEERLNQLAAASPRIQAAGVEVIVVPNRNESHELAKEQSGLLVSEGIGEITETYALFARSFLDESLLAVAPHVEFLIDKQGYIRARWLPVEGGAWENIGDLLLQAELLRKENPRAPAPEEHVH